MLIVIEEIEIEMSEPLKMINTSSHVLYGPTSALIYYRPICMWRKLIWKLIEELENNRHLC